MTTRELQILWLLSTGLRTKQVAERLGVSEKYIAMRTWQMRRKLGYQTNAQMLHQIRSKGYIEKEGQ